MDMGDHAEKIWFSIYFRNKVAADALKVQGYDGIILTLAPHSGCHI